MSGPLDRYFAKQGKRKIDQTETGSADEGHETNSSKRNPTSLWADYTGLRQLLLTKEPYSADFRDFLHLIELMLVMPISAAQCERGFSAQGRIKRDVRSCLNVSTTEDLIRIGLEGPAVDQYDPTSAVHRWLNLSTRARRPTFRHWPTAIDVIETNNDENSDLSEN